MATMWGSMKLGPWKEGPSTLGIQRESRFQAGMGNAFTTEEEASELGIKPWVRFQKVQMGDEALQADRIATRTEVAKHREQTVIQFGWTMVYCRG